MKKKKKKNTDAILVIGIILVLAFMAYIILNMQTNDSQLQGMYDNKPKTTPAANANETNHSETKNDST